MNNIVVRILIHYWPVFLAVTATVLLIYHWMRPKITAEKIQKGMVRQGVLLVASEFASQEDEHEQQEWVEARQKIKDYLTAAPLEPRSPTGQIQYRHYLTLSLFWILFWAGSSTFIIIRIILNPHYYGNEATLLGYFAYYIVLGLISYFRR